MIVKPLIIEALENIGPCDIETLASHMDQSQNIISAMLVKFMRVGAVKVVNGEYALSPEYQAKEETPPAVEVTAAPQISKTVNDVTDGNSLTTSDSADHPWHQYPAVSNQVKTDTTPPDDKIIPGKVLIPSPTERLRKALIDAGREVSAVELATMSGVILKSVSALMNTDIKQGKVILRKDGRKAFYRMTGQTAPVNEKAHTPSTGAPDAETIPITQLSRELPTSPPAEEAQGLADDLTSEKPLAPTTITVPSSAAIQDELSILGDQFIEARERFEWLKREHRRKGELLILVQKLERFMHGGEIYD